MIIRPPARLPLLICIAASFMAGPVWAIVGPSGATAVSPPGFVFGRDSPDDFLLAGAIMLAAGAMLYFGGRRKSERGPSVGGAIEGLFLAIMGGLLSLIGGALLFVGGVWWLFRRLSHRSDRRGTRRRARRRQRERPSTD